MKFVSSSNASRIDWSIVAFTVLVIGIGWAATILCLRGEQQREIAHVTQSNANLARAALTVNKRQESALLDSIPDGAWLKDADGRFPAVNRAFARMLGIEPEAAIGKTSRAATERVYTYIEGCDENARRTA